MSPFRCFVLRLQAGTLAVSLVAANAFCQPAPPHFSPRVKRVIFLYMAGGPSHLETFDYKPKLDQLDGQPMPTSFTSEQPIAQLQGQALKVQGHLTKFKQQGTSGLWLSDFLPHHRRIVDKICVVRSMLTEQINHDPAHTFLNTRFACDDVAATGDRSPAAERQISGP